MSSQCKGIFIIFYVKSSEQRERKNCVSRNKNEMMEKSDGVAQKIIIILRLYTAWM
jgi:hypothetical protein